MDNNHAEELLEKIFCYMSCLVDEKEFSITIQLLTDLGKALVDSDRVTFWYRDTKKKQYWTLAASNGGKIVVPEGSGIVGASIENCEIIMINDPYNDERFNSQIDKETGYVTRSILCMPVTNEQGNVIGAYQAINKLGERDGFDESDVNRLALAAVYSGKMLETYLLKYESQYDQLTGLKNRRGLTGYYDNLISGSYANCESYMIMCDIDYFKNVNDEYGHSAGDAELMYIADILRYNVGDAANVIRWGGEEFLIILPKSTAEYAVTLANVLRNTIEEAEYTFEDNVIKVTMSFGVVEIDKNLSLEENVEAADARLYKAKESGRNCVCC